MVQSVKHLTLDFGSGHDLVVCGFKHESGSVLTAQRLLGILSAPPLLVLCLSLSLSLKNK